MWGGRRCSLTCVWNIIYFYVYKKRKKGRTMLEQKIFEFVTKYNLIENGDKIVLGVSGGPDSICMLDILNKMSHEKKLDFEIVVCHVNHGLRENAILDEEFVKDFCEKKGVQFFVKHVDIQQISKEQKRGLEETGRLVRYEFFDEILAKTRANKIAIAHNANDNAETIIMNILRGTGTKGLIGMEPQNGKYIRPLIETRRAEIESYLEQNNIVARHDESNDENIYTRNKVRNIVLPYIEKEFNPSILTSLGRLSDIAKEQEEYLKLQTEKYYEEVCVSEDYVAGKLEITINLRQFNLLEKIIQKRIILHAINKIFGTTQGIEKIHIDDIIKLCNNNIGNKYLTPNKNVKIVTQKKQLKIIDISG